MTPFGPDHERWADATGSFLLGAMPADERSGFEAHLEQCAFCREEVEFLRVAADALPFAVPQVAPPSALRSRIMAVVEREAELLQAAEAPVRPAPVERRPWSRRLDVVPRRAGLALAATMLLLVGGLGGVLVAGDGAPSERVLRGTAVTAGTDVRLVVAGDRARLEADRLPGPPRGRVYQVWIKRSGEPAPEPTDALFVPAADGSATAGVPVAVDEDVEAILVTHERAGGAQVPTVDPVLEVPVSSS